MVEVLVSAIARVSPTEDESRVRLAVLNLFPDADVASSGGEIRATSRNLDRIAELVANHRIPDSARSVMLRGRPMRGAAVTRFTMGKQAAFVGRPHFAAPEGPLGEIVVEIDAATPDELEDAIFAAAPDTTVDAALARVPPSRRPV